MAFARVLTDIFLSLWCISASTVYSVSAHYLTRQSPKAERLSLSYISAHYAITSGESSQTGNDLLYISLQRVVTLQPFKDRQKVTFGTM